MNEIVEVHTSMRLMRARKLSTLVFVPLLLAVNTLAGETGPDNPRQIKGDIWAHVHNDTLTLRYEIRTDHFVADSVLFGDSCIYRRGESTEQIRDFPAAIAEASRHSITGVRQFLFGAGEHDACTFTGYGRDSSGQPVTVYQWAEILPSRVNALLQVSYGYGHFKGEGTVGDINCLLGGVGGGFSWDHPKGSLIFEASGNFGGTKKNYFAKGGTAIRYKYFFGSRTDYLPAPIGGVEFAAISAKKDDHWLRKGGEFGVEGGIALQGRFERLSYSYHTIHDGYHSVQLLMAIASSEESIGGTVFGLDFGKDFFTITLSIRAEGLDADGIARGFHRFENRPWWHRALSYASVAPLYPIALVVRLFEKK